MKNKPTDMLDRYIRARYPIIGIVSHEETRVVNAIREVAGRKRTMIEWSYTRGLTRNGEQYGPQGSANPAAALAWISTEFESDDNHLFIFKDLHRMLDEIKIVRYLRDISEKFQIFQHNLILVSPTMKIPADLEKTMAVIDWPLPTTEELADVLNEAEKDLDGHQIPITLNGNRDQVVQAMRGLTDTEAANVLKAAIVATRELGESAIPFIIREKAQIIRKSGLLEYYDETVTMEEVGGLSSLKKYAAKKRKAMSAAAREEGLDAPKGVMLLGVPGTGKSLSAKAIAGGKLPLIRLDMGRVLGGGHVGEAENNVTAVHKLVEAIAPCVLWMDEIEKAFADNGGASDGGVMMRILGAHLTWMQETKAPVYSVATCNSVDGLRPELLSRFDDIMWIDLPDKASRVEIITVHLTKRKRNPASIDLDAVTDATWGFSGREIEKVIKFALEDAYMDAAALTTNHLLEAAARIVPTSETKKDEIDAMRSWVKNKAVEAGNPLEPKPQTRGKRGIDL